MAQCRQHLLHGYQQAHGCHGARKSTKDHRIIKLFRLENTSRTAEYNHLPSTARFTLNRMFMYHTHTTFEHFQGWLFHQFPRKHVPMTDQPFGETMVANIQPKLSLVQLERISSVLFLVTQEKRLTPPLYNFFSGREVSPEPPFSRLNNPRSLSCSS